MPRKCTSKPHVPARTVKRLLRDMQEIESNPLPSVAALPLPHDILTWHVNLRPKDGPFENSIFHFRLHFPEDYPANPPEVEMLSTGMPGHPNVFGSAGHVYICLSMLKSHTATVKYDGWTSAYSVMSLLLQLQSFLFADTHIEQDYGETAWHTERAYGECCWDRPTIKRVRTNNKAFTLWIDDDTLHTHNHPWPPFADEVTLSTSPTPDAVLIGRTLQARAQALQEELQKIDSLQKTMQKLHGNFLSSHGSYRDVALLSHGREELPKMLLRRAPFEAELVQVTQELAAHKREQEREAEELVSQMVPLDLPTDLLLIVSDFLRTEDLPAFGRVCVAWRHVLRSFNLFTRRQLCCYYSKERYGDPTVILGVGLQFERHSNGALKEVSTPFDIISATAFTTDHARLSVWKHPFTHFLPLAIDKRHFERSLPLVQRLTKQAFGENAQTPQLLDLLSAAMNSMVVQLFNSHSHAGDAPPLHASEVALDGYCAFHHLLLSCAHRWPAVRASADRRVAAFLSCEYARHKKNTRDLGRLLVSLTLSGKGWGALCYPFLREMLARNVRWVVQKKPFLLATGPPHAVSATERARHTFDASRTSLRLVAFQIFFLNLVGRPEGSTGFCDVLAAYEHRLGRPTPTQRNQLQSMAKRTLQLSSWEDFFKIVGAAVPNKNVLDEILVGAVHASTAKGYYGHAMDHRRLGRR